MTEIPSNHWLNAIGRTGARRDRMAAPPPSYPIAEAPAMPGKPFEPVLLWPGDEQGNWRFGRWNGLEWANDDDFIVYPLRYALLPDVPAGEALRLPAPAARSIESDAAAMLPAIAAGAPSDVHALALHRRWSVLVDELGALRIAIDNREMAAGLRWPCVDGKRGRLFSEAEIDEAYFAELKRFRVYPGRPIPAAVFTIEKQRAAMKALLAERRRKYEAGCERHGIAPLIARREALAAQLDETLDAIAAMPIRTAADLAVLFDVAIEYELDLSDLEKLHVEWWWTLALMRAVAALAPGFAFTSPRRWIGRFMAFDASGIPIAPAAADPV